MNKSESPRALSFDERNEEDFAEITRRIHVALEKLSTDRRLKRTQANLAKLAGCSRGTLRNRGWPLEKLATFKNETKEALSAAAKQEQQIAVEKSPVEILEERLTKNRDELLAWKYKHDAMRDKVQTIEAQRDAYKRRTEQLEADLRAIALRATVPAQKNTVINFPSSDMKPEPSRGK